MLKQFPWDDRFLLGIPQIDCQHQELIRRVNTLALYMNRKEAWENIRDTIHFLEEYVVTHFRDEEALMEKAGYPKLKEHRTLHADYSAQVNALVFRIQGKDITPDLIATTNRLLVDWLSHHIDEDDRQFAVWANSRQFPPTSL